MGIKYLYLVFFLMVAAALFQADAVLTALYFLVGAFAIGRWWSRRALAGVQFKRTFVNRVFPGEQVRVRLELTNTSRLPVLWLRIRESLPVGVGVGQFQEVAFLAGRQTRVFEYMLWPKRRGYYPIGPLSLYSGDVLGLLDDQRCEGAPDSLTVYPKVVPLSQPRLPSRMPTGNVRHTQPIYEDPNRILGKRDYVVGDSLRRVDWKSTANLGRLQVKQYEPSISLETMVLLNLCRADYDTQRWIDATELAVVVAASLANWIIARKQSVGLCANGKDALDAPAPLNVPMRTGRAHLMRILDVLARIEAADGLSCEDVLRRERDRLPWGTTLVVISGKAGDVLFDELFAAQRAGLNTVMVLCGPVARFDEACQRARRFGIEAWHIPSERDMDVWRR
ncbi:MAG: DUF58 domain-containing protein [Anaerolineae bacterium]|nr:DUF58 domain-containing protein [Thermoflexales bacterium]MDW8407672.1 DUF58 domain-containing protein [Anaerolineae bacterium]